MADSLDALIEELRASAERRSDLRRLLLGEAPDLEGALTRLAAAQERTEARLEALAAAQERTEARLEALAAAQERTEARVQELAEGLDRLTARVDRLGERVEQLAEGLDRLTARVDRLGERVEQLTEGLDRLTGRVDQIAEHISELSVTMQDLVQQVKLLAARMDAVTQRADRAHGYLVERRYSEKGHAYFQRIARRLRRLEPAELDELLASAGVSEVDAEEVRYADAVFTGRLRQQDTDGYLVVETSVTIGHEDVTRAHERATVLRNAGITAVGVVAGESVAEGVGGAARFLGVWQVTDGSVVPPDDNDPVVGAA